MIYCVEDDESSRELMVYALNSANLDAAGFENAAEFWKALKKSKPGLIILDIMLPDEGGLSILKKLRADSATECIPVIMASARGTEYDKVNGLDLGADDYLAKPFGMMEMVSRVRAVLRRSAKKNVPEILKAGDICMNTMEHTVTVHGENVELTLKEYELLKLFMSNMGRAFTRDVLLENVWNDDFGGETRTVDVHVGTLRTKLKDQGDRIHTVRGVGYRMQEQE